MASVEQPVVMLLDGLDQLSAEHQAHRLSWLPRTLPPHVYLVVSTLTDHPTFIALRAAAAGPPTSPPPHVDACSPEDYFVEVAPLSRQLSMGLVKEWLRQAGRDLTPTQFDVVDEALTRCTLPLYTSLVFEEVICMVYFCLF